MQKRAGLGWTKEAGLGLERMGGWGCWVLGFLFAFRGGFMRHVICINTVNTRFWGGLGINKGTAEKGRGVRCCGTRERMTTVLLEDGEDDDN